ncbi:MAG: ABC transporter ATP-binding protein [Acidimicrobiia bacterium]|nr:ABC transporter ATP-binding protein [Acidimicrobiia bacterium]
MGIKLEGLHKVFQTNDLTVQALRDVSAEIDDGEFVSIIGPSGCGKSTLLRLVSGLIPSSQGTVYLDEVPVAGPAGNIGFVFQAPTLLKWRTVLKNVMFPYEVLASQGKVTASKQEYEDRARMLLAMAGLEDFPDAYPKQLSGGMQQRVSICRALIHDPELLLMDEPFGALDEFTRERMNEELLKIWRETRKTVIFVTHHIPEAVFLSDRILVMSPRPGTILGEVVVDLPRPRAAEMRESVEFLEQVVATRHLIGVRPGDDSLSADFTPPPKGGSG